MNKDGSCYLGIVEKVVENISKYVNLDEKLVVIRSTIPPGTSSRLNCYFMPEFLTEKNFEFDFMKFSILFLDEVLFSLTKSILIVLKTLLQKLEIEMYYLNLAKK